MPARKDQKIRLLVLYQFFGKMNFEDDEQFDKPDQDVSDIVHAKFFLPEVDYQMNPDVLEVAFTYSRQEQKPFEAPPVTATVKRMETASETEGDEVVIEMKRLETVNVVKEARGMADQKKLVQAKNMVDAAKDSLGDVNVDDPQRIIKSLQNDLQQLHKLMRTQTMYERLGRPYALSFESSHDNQRYAARGDDLESQRAFATPRMDAYLKQAKEFDKNPTNHHRLWQMMSKKNALRIPLVHSLDLSRSL